MCRRGCSLPLPVAHQDSIKKLERELMLERRVTLMEEKQVILKRQQEEVSRLMQTQVGSAPAGQWTSTGTVRAEVLAGKRGPDVERAGGLSCVALGEQVPSPVSSGAKLFFLFLCFSDHPGVWGAVILASPLWPLWGLLGLSVCAHWVLGSTVPGHWVDEDEEALMGCHSISASPYV